MYFEQFSIVTFLYQKTAIPISRYSSLCLPHKSESNQFYRIQLYARSHCRSDCNISQVLTFQRAWFCFINYVNKRLEVFVQCILFKGSSERSWSDMASASGYRWCYRKCATGEETGVGSAHKQNKPQQKAGANVSFIWDIFKNVWQEFLHFSD